MTTTKDTDIREALRRKYAETPQLPADFMQRMQQATEKKKERRTLYRWIYPALAIAASVVLLFSVGVIRNFKDGEEPGLVAKTDSMKTAPRTETKKVEQKPMEKGNSTEVADSVKMMKERYRTPRPPKHYMAKVETTTGTPEPEIIDEVELAERAFVEERRRMEMEMMAQMSGSLQADFKALTDEIRSRGEQMTQQVEIAMSNEE